MNELIDGFTPITPLPPAHAGKHLDAHWRHAFLTNYVLYEHKVQAENFVRRKTLLVQAENFVSTGGKLC